MLISSATDHGCRSCSPAGRFKPPPRGIVRLALAGINPVVILHEQDLTVMTITHFSDPRRQENIR